MTTRVVAHVSGRVQGVGFRDWVRRRASRLGLAGSATNLRDGRVAIVAEGTDTAVQELLTALRSGEPPGAVGEIDEAWERPRGDLTGFGVY